MKLFSRFFIMGKKIIYYMLESSSSKLGKYDEFYFYEKKSSYGPLQVNIPENCFFLNIGCPWLV
jgi:hypothetical protein